MKQQRGAKGEKKSKKSAANSSKTVNKKEKETDEAAKINDSAAENCAGSLKSKTEPEDLLEFCNKENTNSQNDCMKAGNTSSEEYNDSTMKLIQMYNQNLSDSQKEELIKIAGLMSTGQPIEQFKSKEQKLTPTSKSESQL